MIRQRILMTGLLIAVVSVVAYSGDAEARCRCRRACGGRWQGNGYNNGYAHNNGYNTGMANYGGQSGWNNANGNAVNADGTLINQGMNPQPANTAGVQGYDGTYSVSKPTIDNQTNTSVQGQLNAPQQIAPAPVQNQVPQTNSSPDPDNEGRNASKIPGTAPTKAPAPAANATP